MPATAPSDNVSSSPVPPRASPTSARQALAAAAATVNPSTSRTPVARLPRRLTGGEDDSLADGQPRVEDTAAQAVAAAQDPSGGDDAARTNPGDLVAAALTSKAAATPPVATTTRRTRARPPLPAFAKLEARRFDYFIRKPSIVLGRRAHAADTTVDVHVSSVTAVSRHHARMAYDTARKHWTIQGIGRLGIAVNGRAIAPEAAPVALKSGALIQVGDCQMYFLLPLKPVIGSGATYPAHGMHAQTPASLHGSAGSAAARPARPRKRSRSSQSASSVGKSDAGKRRRPSTASSSSPSAS